MTIVRTLVSQKEVTFQFTDDEWDILQWINAHRTSAHFLEWLTAQLRIMGQRKEEQLREDIKREYVAATPSVKAQIQTLLGVT